MTNRTTPVAKPGAGTMNSASNISLHPPMEQLQKFVAGELGAGLSVAVSAHIEFCTACQYTSAGLETQVSAVWNDASNGTSAAVDEHRFSKMLDRIVSTPQAVASAPPAAVAQETVMQSIAVPLPSVLAKIAAAGLSWKQLPGGVSQALVKLDDQTKCEFIYMKPGSRAPAHTHRGNEVMLVLDGTFCDELGEYKAADFVMRDPSHTHQPRTENGCLCFSVLDSPLVFTEGLMRLLNPLNRLMFLQSQWFRL